MADAQYGYSSGGASVASTGGYGSQYGSYGNDSYGSSYGTGTAGSANYGSTAPYGAQQAGYQSTASDQYSGYSTQSQPNIYDGQSAPSGYYSTGASGGAAGGGQTGFAGAGNSFGANSYYTSHGGSHPPGGQSAQSYGQFGSGGGSGQYSGQSAQSQMSGYNMPPGGMPGGPGGPYSAGPGGHYGPGGASMSSHGPPFHDGLGPAGGMRGPPNSNFRGGHGGGRNSGPGYMNKGRGGGFGGPSDYGMQDLNQDTIFISGLPSDVNDEQLVQHFGQIGVIKIDKKTNKPKVWIYRDKITGKGKGEATLTYDDPHTAKSAIDWFNNKEFLNTGGKVTVDFAQRKSNMDFGGGFRGNRGGGSRGGRGGPGGPRGPSDNGGRQGDWRCPVPTCNNNNFAWRNECNRCKTPRPDDDGNGGPGLMTPNVIDGSPRRDGRGMGMSRGGGGPRGRGGAGGDRGRGGGRGGIGGGRGGRGGPPRGGGMGGRGGPMGGGGGGGGPMRSTHENDRRQKPY